MRNTLLLAITALAACAPSPGFRESPVPVPVQFRESINHSSSPAPVVVTPAVAASVEGAAHTSDDFWQALGDTTLNRLLEEVSRQNLELRGAQARVGAARAARERALLDLTPSLAFNGGYARQRLSRDEAETLDRAPIVEEGVANTIDVGGRSPGVERRVLRKAMGGRAIAPVCRNVHHSPHRFAKPLETHSQERDSARNVPGECPERRSFPYVDLDELPQQEMAGQLDFHGRVPRRDLVEIAGQLAAPPGGVLPLFTRPQGLPVLRRKRKPVNYPKWEGGGFVAGISGEDG